MAVSWTPTSIIRPPSGSGRTSGWIRWPAELDDSINVSDTTRQWAERCQSLAIHADDDGIVCLQPVRGEKPAHERLLALLIDAWESVEPSSWKPATLEKLLTEADCAGKGLEVWLRDKFFEQHARRFSHSPFVWHVWDGLKDGFAALVNYHRLDEKNLERLIHTYLGDWLRTQEAGLRDGVDGASQRLAAALDLKRPAGTHSGRVNSPTTFSCAGRLSPSNPKDGILTSTMGCA